MKIYSKASSVIFSITLALFCLRSPADMPAMATDQGDMKSYAAKGVVEKISDDRRTLTIHHEDIPGYMMSMTMDFNVKSVDEVTGIVPGDKITFTLVVGKDSEWIKDVHRIGHDEPKSPAPMDRGMSEESPKFQPGDQLPDAEFFSEAGRKIHLSDFRGKVLAFTFFFTRCPLPDYCPLMNRNFAQAQKLLSAMPNTPAWQLLSISFDAQFDQPQALVNYAQFYRGANSAHWLFAAAPSATLATLGPRLGLMLMSQNGTISHNLRTVVLDAQGRLFRQFNDNLWKPQELVDAMMQAGQATPQK